VQQRESRQPPARVERTTRANRKLFDGNGVALGGMAEMPFGPLEKLLLGLAHAVCAAGGDFERDLQRGAARPAADTNAA